MEDIAAHGHDIGGIAERQQKEVENLRRAPLPEQERDGDRQEGALEHVGAQKEEQVFPPCCQVLNGEAGLGVVGVREQVPIVHEAPPHEQDEWHRIEPEKPPCLRKHLPYGLPARQPLEREKQDREAEQKRPFRARQRDQQKQDRRPEERRVPLVQEREGASDQQCREERGFHAADRPVGDRGVCDRKRNGDQREQRRGHGGPAHPDGKAPQEEQCDKACGNAEDSRAGFQIEPENGRHRKEDGPEKCRITLDPLSQVPDEPLSVHEMPDVPERDERVVLHELEVGAMVHPGQPEGKEEGQRRPRRQAQSCGAILSLLFASGHVGNC